MSRIEEIQIPFEINAAELDAQAKEVQKSMSDIDHASDKARSKFKQFEKEQQQAHKATGKTVSAVKTQYNALGHSINQLTREMPAFTYNAQTGFMAISNNIPMFADAISNLSKQNKALTASGQKATPVWKQLAGALFSWNTLLSVGITLITVYGKEIGDWLGKLLKGNATLDTFKQRIKAINAAFESSSYTKASKQILKLKADFKAAEKGLITKEKALKQYNKTVGKSMGRVNSFAAAEKKLINQGDDYVKMMLYKAAALASLDEANKEIIAKQKEKLAKETELNKYNTILTSRNAAVKRSVGTGRAAEAAVMNSAKASMDVADTKEEITELKNEIKKTDASAVNVYNSLMANAKKIAEEFKFDLFSKGIDGDKKTKKIASEYQKLLNTLKDLDKEYSKKTFDKDKAELNALKDKFAKVRTLIQAFNKDKKNKVKIDLTGLNSLETKATDSLKYRQGTNKLVTGLEAEKELYQAYEAFKTKVGQTEAKKRYDLQFNQYATYLQRIQGEIAKVENQNSPESKERLARLKELETAEKNRQDTNQTNRFAEAYQAALTFDEKRKALNVNYEAQRLELDKITDKKLRQQKQAALDQQHALELDKLKTDNYAQQQVLEQLGANLLGITKKQLNNRIETLEEYLQRAEGSLTKEQEEFVKAELKKAKAVQASTDIGVEEKTLLQEKHRLEKQIADIKNKGNGDVQQELDDLEKINSKLKGILAKKLSKFASVTREVSDLFLQIGDAVYSIDEGLSDTLTTASELGTSAANIAEGFASLLLTGNPLGLIKGIISGVATLFSLRAKARESERKANEEIKKYYDDIFNSQLAYNAELRKRISDEIKLNDLYKSRVANIKEEIAANKEKFKSVVEDQQAIFNRLLKSETIVGKHKKKYGGFIGIGRKTKVVNDMATVKSLLGLRGGGLFGTRDIKLTDEIFEKLEKLNRDKPLTGDAKQAYEELKKLRDEYGSIANAQRELQKQLKDAVTGTTAKSLADSIREGILSGKKQFSDFADDIETFLRQGIIAGMNAKIIEPQMQMLQDELYAYLGDGVLTADEKKAFQEMYMKVANEAKQYMDLMNQAGVDMTTGFAGQNSLKGAYKTASQESINLLAGQTGGFRLTQLNTNSILKSGFVQQLAQTSKQIELQQKIEKNTRKTATNTEELKPIRNGIDKLAKNVNKTTNTAKANGF